MAKYKAYPEYKDSGVEWLGEIPTSWQMWKLSHAYEVIGSGTTPTSNNESYFQGDIPWVTTGELREKIIYDTDKKVKESTLQIFSALKIHPAGSVVIAMYGATIGRLGILGVDATTNQACCVMTKSKIINNQYLYYWLQAYRTEIIRLSSGGGQPNINQEKVSSLKVSAPVLNDQTLIVAFLDHETAKIDNLIEKQQQLIELLKEKRQAVISHAVTKGLNPDVPMKDSGVEWLGEVPEHWNVKKLKYACASIIAGPFGSSITKDMYVNDGYKVYGQEQVIPNDFNIGDYFISTKDFEKLSRYEINAGDILISCVGTFGKIAVFPDWARVGIINPRLIKATLAPKMNPSFIREFLKSTVVSKQFELLSRGGTMGVINIAILNEIMISIPPIEEQNSINEFIHSQKKKFFELIDNANSQINLLQERRTALISAAVTGKIDVRDWVAPDTQNVEEPQEATA